MRTWRSEIARGLFVAALALGVAVAAYGAYLLTIGPTIVSYREVAPGQPLPPGMSRHEPTLIGAIPLLAGASVVIGLLVQLPLIAWAGAFVVALFAGLFMFGVGGALIPFATALLLVLAGHVWLSREPTRADG